LFKNRRGTREPTPTASVNQSGRVTREISRRFAHA
jgi:hypothetical protein